MGMMKSESSSICIRTKKNTMRLAYWTGAWVVSTALATFGPKFLWDYSTLPTIAGVLVHLGIGFGMIISNKRHLLGLDELQQKIQLNAMAMALGIGLVVSLAYELLEDIKLITFEPEISHLIILMGLTYFFGTVIGQRRYR